MDRREFFERSAVLSAGLFMPDIVQKVIEPLEKLYAGNKDPDSMLIGDFYDKGKKVNNPRYPEGTALVERDDLENLYNRLYEGGYKDPDKVKDKKMSQFLYDFRNMDGLREVFEEHGVNPSKFDNLVGDNRDTLDRIFFFSRDKENEKGYITLFLDSREAYVVPTNPPYLIDSVKEFYKSR